jgi:hypothetical protein
MNKTTFNRHRKAKKYVSPSGEKEQVLALEHVNASIEEEASEQKSSISKKTKAKSGREKPAGSENTSKNKKKAGSKKEAEDGGGSSAEMTASDNPNEKILEVQVGNTTLRVGDPNLLVEDPSVGLRLKTGIAIHISLNEVDPGHYGDSFPLFSCDKDAARFFQIFAHTGEGDSNTFIPNIGWTGTSFHNENATREKVIAELKKAAAFLVAGDFLWLTYAGHGSQIPDKNNREFDGYNETWCLFDGMLLDDELYELWTLFRPGVRILVISDSCHSGTILDAPKNHRSLALRSLVNQTLQRSGKRNRALRRDLALEIYNKHAQFYDSIMDGLAGRDVFSREIKASIKVWSACQDNQEAGETDEGGLFSTSIIRQLGTREVRSSLNYQQLFHNIVKHFPSSQTPGEINIGQTDPSFDQEIFLSITRQKPSRIDAGLGGRGLSTGNGRGFDFGKKFKGHTVSTSTRVEQVLPPSYHVDTNTPLADLLEPFPQATTLTFKKTSGTFAGTKAYAFNSPTYYTLADVGTIAFWYHFIRSAQAEDFVLFSIGEKGSSFTVSILVQNVDRPHLRISFFGQQEDFPFLEGFSTHHVAIYLKQRKVVFQGNEIHSFQQLEIDDAVAADLSLNPFLFGADEEEAVATFIGEITGFLIWSSNLSPAELYMLAHFARIDLLASHPFHVPTILEKYTTETNWYQRNLIGGLNGNGKLELLPEIPTDAWVNIRQANEEQPGKLNIAGLDSDHHGFYKEIPFFTIQWDTAGRNIHFITSTGDDYQMRRMPGGPLQKQNYTFTVGATDINLTYDPIGKEIEILRDIPGFPKGLYTPTEKTVHESSVDWGSVFTHKPYSLQQSFLGWDIRKMDLPPNIRFTGTSERIFAYPEDTSMNFRAVEGIALPNGITYLPIGYTESSMKTEMIDTVSEQDHTDTNQSSSSKGGGIKTPFLEANFDYNHNKSTVDRKKEITEHHSSITINQSFASSYVLIINKKDIELTEDFRKNWVKDRLVAHLYDADDRTLRARIGDFFETFGTHYCNAVTYGGRGYQKNVFRSNSLLKLSEKGTNTGEALKAEASGLWKGLGGKYQTESSTGANDIVSVQNTLRTSYQSLQAYGNISGIGSALHEGSEPAIPVFLDPRPISDLFAPPFFEEYQITVDLRKKVKEELDKLLTRAQENGENVFYHVIHDVSVFYDGNTIQFPKVLLKGDSSVFSGADMEGGEVLTRDKKVLIKSWSTSDEPDHISFTLVDPNDDQSGWGFWLTHSGDAGGSPVFGSDWGTKTFGSPVVDQSAYPKVREGRLEFKVTRVTPEEVLSGNFTSIR